MVELVEKEIGKEMQKTKGAILYDGWTSNATHFMGLFAVYCTEVTYFHGGRPQQKSVVRAPVLSISPMAKPGSEDHMKEAESFHADVHIHHFREIFPYYECTLEDWKLCQIADNCPVNIKIADRLGIPHVGCMSHKMHLEMHNMINQDIVLKQLLDSIGDVMRHCKAKLKNRAILRNLSDLTPVLPNETRWSGRYRMLKRFNQLRDKLIMVSQTEGADLTMETSLDFRTLAVKYERMLKEMNDVTLLLQKEYAKLWECRISVDELVDSVNKYRNKDTSNFYACAMETKYIAADSDIVKYPCFENGVAKIQMNQLSSLTDDEMDACKGLLVETVVAQDIIAVDDADLDLTDRIAMKKRKAIERTGTYRDCSFILGSMAIAERMWSIADNIMIDSRSYMTPIVFESLLYLRINSEYWNEHTVKEAMRTNRS